MAIFHLKAEIPSENMSVDKPSMTIKVEYKDPIPNEMVSYYLWVHRRRRPIPQDIHVPNGFVRLPSGMIAPKRPETSGVRYEGQHPDDTQEEHLIRRSAERWGFAFLMSAFLVLAVNFTVAIARETAQYEFAFPIGFIPVPFLIWTMTMMKKKRKKLDTNKQERRESVLPPPPNARPSIRGRGTTTVTR